MAQPVSLKIAARALTINGASFPYGEFAPKSSNLPDFSQSNLPLSTITPAIDVPCPPINFVALWITISAPNSIGFKIGGGVKLNPPQMEYYACAQHQLTLQGLP